MMTTQEIRQACAALRQFIALEDELCDLAEREMRVPTALAAVDGFPPGGNGGGSGAALNDAGKPSSITERLALALVDNEAHDDDPVGERIVAVLFSLQNMATASRTARRKVTEAAKMSSLRKPLAHLAEVCVEDGCEELAVPGGRGRCEPDRKWLERHPEVQHVPAVVVERRNERRSN